MRNLILPLLLLPAVGLAQTPIKGQDPTQAPLPGQVPGPAKNQTPPVMPDIVPIPTPGVVTIPAVNSPDLNKPLTAEEAARLALRVQPSLRLAEAQLLAAQGKLRIAKAGLLPTLTVSAAYGRTLLIENGTYSFPPATTTTSTATGTSGIGTSASTNNGTYAGLANTVSVKQLLFDFNRTRNLVRQADALEKAAKHGLTLAQLNLVYAVKQAYYTYVQDQSLVDVQKANLASTQAQYDLANGQLKAGLGAPANVVTAATAVGQASEALNQAQQTALVSRINLAIAIGVDPRTPIELSSSEEAVPPSTDVNALVNQALNQRPDILLAKETIRAAGFELSAAHATTAPTVSLSLGATSSGGSTPITNTAGALGLTVSWEIFDGGVTEGNIKSASADLITAKSQLDTTTLTVVSDVSVAYANLKTQEQQILIAQASVTDAEEGVRLAEGQFRAGVGIFLQVTTAQTTLVQARTSLVQAQQALQQARAQLRRAIGAS